MSHPQTINQNRDFIRLYKRGHSLVSPILVTYCLKNRWGGLRVGITATKKIGGAVQRNRAKRVIRAACYNLEGGLVPGYDYVFVARGRTPRAKSQEVQKIMTRHIRELTMFQENKRLEKKKP